MGFATVEENYCQRSSFCFYIKKALPRDGSFLISPSSRLLRREIQPGRVPGRRWPRTGSLAFAYAQGMFGGSVFLASWLEGRGPPSSATVHTHGFPRNIKKRGGSIFLKAEIQMFFSGV